MKTRSRSDLYAARLKVTFPSRKCDSRKISASGRVQQKSPKRRNVASEGWPEDSLSWADSVYLRGRTHTMAILTKSRPVSTFESTIPHQKVKIISVAVRRETSPITSLDIP